MIPYGRQTIDDDDVDAVVRVLKGEWLTQGPHVEEFELAVAEKVGARFAVAFASGTVALHAATYAADLGLGSVVGTSALTFVASANCARAVGADVRFVDVDPKTLNLDLSLVPANLDALIAVHYAGLPMDLSALAGKRPRIVIEDAAHALGAQTPDGPVGRCTHSDLCVFSFHPVKTVTTGEGGVVTTNDEKLATRLRRFRNHGIEPRPERGGWYYEVVVASTNGRLTDIQAALGTSQLAKLDRFVERRNHLANWYRQELAGLPLDLPPAAPDGWLHAYHLFVVRVADRRRIYDALRERGIATQVHYVPVHHHPIYRDQLPHGGLPETDAAYDRILSLPLFPSLTDEEQRAVIDALRDVL